MNIDVLLKAKLFGIVILSCFVGCDKKSSGSGRSADSSLEARRTTPRTMRDLQILLSPGISTNDIVSALGKAQWINSVGDASEWFYSLTPFPAERSMSGSYVVGVGVSITNGRIAHWGATYSVSSDSSGFEIPIEQTNSPADKAQPATLNLFFVSATPIPGGRVIDNEQFPKLGFISSYPTLSISRIKEVTEKKLVSHGNSEAGTVWSFRISLFEEDGRRLGYFTETNVLNKILVMANDKPFIAPTILAPVNTGIFLLEFTEESLAEAAARHLKRMQVSNLSNQ